MTVRSVELRDATEREPSVAGRDWQATRRTSTGLGSWIEKAAGSGRAI